MTRITLSGLVAVLLAFTGQATAEEKVAFELRRAFTKKAPGLEQKTLVGSGKKFYVAPKAELTFAELAKVKLDKSGMALEVEFTEAGGKRLAKLTSEHQDKPLAILIDGKLIAAPIIRDTISTKTVLYGIDKETMQRIIKQLQPKK